MGYDASTITSATPGEQLRLALTTLFDAHSNWTFQESLTNGTITYYVWKNHGSAVADPNSFGSDFYISIEIDTANPARFRIKAFEQYTSGAGVYANARAIKWVAGPSTATTTNADGSFGAAGGVVLATTTLGWADANMQVSPVINEYYMQVSKNAIKIATRTPANNGSIYVGLFEPFLPSSETTEFPLIMVSLQAGSPGSNFVQAYSALSRMPKMATGTNIAQHYTATIAAFTTLVGNTNQIDLLHGKSIGARAVILHSAGAAQSAVSGYFRGLLYDVTFLANQTGITPQQGDTYVIDSNTHTRIFLGNLSNVWFDQAAV